ncbi:MAG: response regulator [Gemmatimonadota bacterium]
MTATEKVNILLVDDQPGKLLTYEAILSELGENLIVANSGREALELLLKHDVTVVLMDVSMPELDGFELAEIIHAHPRFQKVAIIFVSAVHLSDMDRLKGYQSGAVDYVPVPVVPELLRAKVRVFTELYRHKRALERLTAELEARVAQRTEELEQSIRGQQRLTNQLLQNDRRKDEFLALLGHELRNPLAPVRNAVTILRMKDAHVDPQVTACVDIIERQTTQLTRLVDDLLDVSRVTQGKISLRSARQDMEEIVQAAIEMSRPLIDTRRHIIHVRADGRPALVLGDATRLTQVISNLLNNAAKYQNEGGRIEVFINASGDEVVTRVRDYGIGVPPEMLEEIFDLFSQADRTSDRANGGLGIGLSLVRSLVELHGGRVSASSDGVGQGAEFVVLLPALHEAKDQPATASADAPPFASPHVVVDGQRVLIVDDNRDAAESLATLLRLRGHEVAVTYDGLDGLRIAGEWQPSIVFLDIGLPTLDGYDVCRQLRASHGDGMQIVAMTGYGMERDKELAREAGFDAHTVKPVDIVMIHQIIADAATR